MGVAHSSARGVLGVCSVSVTRRSLTRRLPTSSSSISSRWIRERPMTSRPMASAPMASAPSANAPAANAPTACAPIVSARTWVGTRSLYAESSWRVFGCCSMGAFLHRSMACLLDKVALVASRVRSRTVGWSANCPRCRLRQRSQAAASASPYRSIGASTLPCHLRFQ